MVMVADKWPYRDDVGWCELAERTCSEGGGCHHCILALEKAAEVDHDS